METKDEGDVEKEDDYSRFVTKWKSIYLFAVFVCAEREQKWERLESTSISDPSRFIALFRSVLGHPYRLTSRPDFLSKLKIENQNRISNFLVDNDRLNEFRIVTVVAKLKPTCLWELMQARAQTNGHDAFDYTKIVHEMIEDMTPSVKDGLSKYSDERAIHHVLYLEPHKTITEEMLPEGDVGVTAAAKELRSMLGIGRASARSVVVQDVLLMPGMGYGNERSAIVATRLRPFSAEKAAEKGPRDTIFDVPIVPLSYLRCCAECDIEEYLSSAIRTKLPQSAEYWDKYRKWRDFTSYRTEFMEVRLRCEEAFNQVSEYFSTVERSSVPYYFSVEFEVPVEDEDLMDGFVYSTSAGIIREMQKSTRANLSRVIEVTKRKLDTLDAFLRDAAFADATEANYRLARTVGTLTFVVTLISVLTLIATVAPERTRHIFGLDFARPASITTHLFEGAG